MKNHFKWLIIVSIISVITACEGGANVQPFQNKETGTKSDSPHEESIDTGSNTTANSKEQDKTGSQNLTKTTTMPDKSVVEKSGTSACQQALERLGQFSVEEGKVDYKSGRRIFPLLNFILTNQFHNALSRRA